MTTCFARLHAPRNLNRTCVEEQFFCKRCLTRIGVRDDGKTAPARDFGKNRIV